MTIKVKQKKNLLGNQLEVETYLPKEELLTNKKRQNADELDTRLKTEVEKINVEYLKLKFSFKNTKAKWYWLGKKIDTLFTLLPFDQKDIYSHIVWLAITQYLNDDLKRIDERRAGTPQDHLNKCWLLFKTKHHSWIKTWIGWDALVERGDQLLNDRLLKKLEIKFTEKLSNRDYQSIFKEITKYIPSQTGRKEIELMSDDDLENIVCKVKECLKNKTD